MSCTTASDPNALTIVRGASATFEITIKDKSKAVIELTGCKLYFTMKNRLEDVTPLITKKTLNAGGADTQFEVLLPQTGTTKGKARFYLVPSDTSMLAPDASYVCDVWVELTSGKRYPIIKKRPFVIEWAVTVIP